jgi:hypothetical protein
MKEQILKIIKEVKGELFDNPEYGEYPESELRLMNQVRALNAIEQKLSDFSPWVSVEDAEPKVFKSRKGDFAAYLFCDVNADCPVPLYGRYVGEHRFLTLGNIEKVATHYMEMPEPPKAK